MRTLGVHPPASNPSAATQPAEPIAINLKEMALFNFDPKTGKLEDIPQKIRDPDGKRVRFAAEIGKPVRDAKGMLLSFDAVYSLNHWSFRGAAARARLLEMHAG